MSSTTVNVISGFFLDIHLLRLTVVYHYFCPGGSLPLTSRVAGRAGGIFYGWRAVVSHWLPVLFFEGEEESVGFPHDADGGVVHDV